MKFALFRVILTICIIAAPYLCKAQEDSTSISKIGLIDTAQLTKAIESQKSESKWVILDARPMKYWEKSHIPGSISFSWENYTKTDSNQVSYRILPTDELAYALGNLGISEQTPIVISGDADQSWGGEGWLVWVFKWLGHQGDLQLLKGGIQAWERAGYSLISVKDEEKERQNIEPLQYRANPIDSMNISAREIFDNPNNYQLVDTRSTIEWFKGHLPNAVHIPWEKFFKGKDRTPIEPEELQSLLKKNSLNMEKTVVYYCSGGIRSGYTWLVHELAALQLKELPKAINFEGGTEEWNKVIKN
ncbi:MAG: hypothetical protein HQK71_10020 [Desulfamplus sp.]|nr:hypothetical protein [Desulfamplus sp.]